MAADLGEKMVGRRVAIHVEVCISHTWGLFLLTFGISKIHQRFPSEQRHLHY